MRATREDALYWIKSAVFLTILIGVGLLPPFSGLTQLDMRILGVFISLIFAYSCIGFIWPSLIGAIALGLSGYAPVESVITTGVGSFDVTIFVASLFIFSSYIDDCGLSEYIAHLFISRKIAIGRPYVLATLLFLCAYVLGAFISMFAAMVLLWNIFYKICEMVGYGKKQPYPMLVLIGIVFSASLGYAIFPFKATQVIALNTLAAAGGPEIDVVRFTAVNIVLGVACILGYLALCKFIFRPDVSKLKTKVDYLAQYRGEKLTHESRVGLIFLVAFIAAMFAPSFIDADGTVGALLNNLGAPGALILLLGIMAAVCRKGKTWFDFAKAAGNINWNIIVLFIVIMPLSARPRF